MLLFLTCLFTRAPATRIQVLLKIACLRTYDQYAARILRCRRPRPSGFFFSPEDTETTFQHAFTFLDALAGKAGPTSVGVPREGCKIWFVSLMTQMSHIISHTCATKHVRAS